MPKIQTWKLEEYLAGYRDLEPIEIRTLALEALLRRSKADEPTTKKTSKWEYNEDLKCYNLETEAGLIGAVYYLDRDHEWRWSVSMRAGGRFANGISDTSHQAKAHAEHWLGIAYKG